MAPARPLPRSQRTTKAAPGLPEHSPPETVAIVSTSAPGSRSTKGSAKKFHPSNLARAADDTAGVAASKTPPKPQKKERGAKKRRSEILTPDPIRIHWVGRAACSDKSVEEFFVVAGRTASNSALAVCRTCPVRKDCLEHAYVGGIDNKPIRFGYFGGLSPDQRRRLTLDEAIARVESQSS